MRTSEVLIPRFIILRMGNILDKSYTENYSTHFLLNFASPKFLPFMR